MIKKITFTFFYFVLFSFLIAAQNAKKFEFKYQEGDNFSLYTTVNEAVKVNGRLSHTTVIENRVTEHVEKVDSDGRGYLLANFMTSELSTLAGLENQTRKWGETFESEFWRAKNGKFEIAPQYFMPVIRDMPIFPDYELNPGDEWSADGYEAEDLRRDLNVKEPFKVPFTAKYKYLGDQEGISSDSSKVKKTFSLISARYTLYYETPETAAQTATDYPVTTAGYSNRTIWWDNEKGQIDHYTEDFKIIMETFYGNQYQFTGKTQAEYTEFKRSATAETVEQVLEKIDGMGLQDISVKKTEQGLTLSLENIQFKADSFELEQSEQEKIKKLAQILNEYPDNDLLISGHTARAGSEESCQALSEERALSVADFIAELKIREKKHIFTQGFGSKVPVASNATEEGKKKNRRVEITILDK